MKMCTMLLSLDERILNKFDLRHCFRFWHQVVQYWSSGLEKTYPEVLLYYKMQFRVFTYLLIQRFPCHKYDSSVSCSACHRLFITCNCLQEDWKTDYRITHFDIGTYISFQIKFSAHDVKSTIFIFSSSNLNLNCINCPNLKWIESHGKPTEM